MAQDTTGRPRKERKENADMRRRQLLDAARRSILAHGLARTTLATVAREAGLSQGVAVFYFKSKAGLLSETLRDMYQTYEAAWMEALAAAGPDPGRQLVAMISSDFSDAACGPEVLPIWYAFWGELRFQADYDAVAEAFDTRRHEAVADVCRALMPERESAEAEQIAEWIETISDGYWQYLHVSPAYIDRETALAGALRAAQVMVPKLVVDP